jgi:Fe-S cluster biogenesis protein NfuA
MNMSVQTESGLLEKIEKALADIRPYLESDGGDISLVEVTSDMVVKVKLHGACQSCNVNQMTLKAGVEQSIKKYAPEIKEVVNIDA